jgi:hypothetical protein
MRVKTGITGMNFPGIGAKCSEIRALRSYADLEATCREC